MYFRVRRLYSRCNSFLVRSVYCILFHSSFTCIDYYTRGVVYVKSIFCISGIQKYMTDCFRQFLDMQQMTAALSLLSQLRQRIPPRRRRGRGGS